MIEYYDEVTRDDVPTGRKLTWEQAHGEGKPPHRCVAVFVLDGQGGLYVQESKLGGNRLDHSVGGHVDSGEDYETAAYREMEEELGITGAEIKEIATGHYSDEGPRIHMFGIYTCTAPKDWVFKPNDEVETIYPMKIEDIVREMNEIGDAKYITGFMNTMQKYLEVTKSELKVEELV